MAQLPEAGAGRLGCRGGLWADPYRTAMEVYLDKTSESVEDTDNEVMRQGREFEEYVARRFTDATGKKVRRANFMYYDEGNPFMLAEQVSGNFYILPSSVHDLILLPDNPSVSAGHLKEIVKEVNESTVAREEWLSEDVYYYDSKEREVRICIEDKGFK